MTKVDNLLSTMTAMCIASEIQTKAEIENARKTRKEYVCPILKESNPKEWRKKQLQKQSRKKNRGKK